MSVKRIVLMGGPCVGKSTLAAELYTELKKLHFPVENVDEFIKPLAWNKTVFKGHDSLWLAANQIKLEESVMLNGGVAISTSTPLVTACYAYARSEDWLADIILQLQQPYEEMYPALNFFLVRDVPYRQEGRYEDATAATLVDARMRDMLSAHQIKVTDVYPANFSEILAMAVDALRSK
jgi:nicotinamide riboside kinase